MTAATSILRGSTAPRRSKAAPKKQAQSPRLRLVEAPSARRLPSLRSIMISLGILAGVFVTQLALSIAISQGAYEVSGLEQTQTELQREESAALEELSAMSSAQNLAVEATKLGMVPTDSQAFLQVGSASLATDANATGTSAPINTGLVTNEVTQPAPAPAADGVSPQPAAAPEVPSVSELRSPSTR
ncbi:hypothetical protein [Pseudoclavibacter sp. RFBA6]|uniref:hypothetical protein n=1 Tax=Pseudoclavibacter sp. RFBA6 TaxID=2080573 RepID=UPI000CE830A1|nr:hypothetical protein [Pseudoclavibacter sp. RFBA6]PPG40708.1 hypothetical protein C5C17_07930 [Pseudoclavibacter sp. RFBA6]